MTNPLQDKRIAPVLDRLHAHNQETFQDLITKNPDPDKWSADPIEFADVPMSISPELGNLMYMLCRAANVRCAVDFATSVGTSAIYIAAAIRDNGGGIVIGSEIVPAKVARAQANLAEAGLLEFVEIREGDATQTLADIGRPVDFALVDGFQAEHGKWLPPVGDSLARRVLDVLIPQLRSGAVLANDNGEPDYLEYVRTEGNGFRSFPLPMMPPPPTGDAAMAMMSFFEQLAPQFWELFSPNTELSMRL